MTSKAGGTIIKGKLKAAVLPGVLVFLIHVFVTPVNRGIAILACIPLCILCAWVLYRDGADPGGPSSPGWGPVTGKESTSYELSSERSGAV